ncbi:MAG: M1 family metallopeptidase [Chitinophagales bacterium]
MNYFLKTIFISSVLIAGTESSAQYTRQDTLRGTIGPERAWWDVLHYDLSVTPDYQGKSIAGRTKIQYKVLAGQKSDYMQIDLQKPLTIDTLFYDDKLYINYPPKPYYDEGNVWHIPLPKAAVNSIHSITIAYHGKPRVAINPPWDGGWIFTRDEKGRPWMTVACQGLGASVWYPCKDHQSDEPDNGATLSMTVADTLVAVGNGRLKEKTTHNNGTTTWTWEVKNPINNYNIIPYIGKYVTWHEDFTGEKGHLDCDYWVLDYNLEKSKKQFGRDVRPMLTCFENWFGPYPFYEDGYKLVESSHLGMEHQSATAYGNHFMDGYLGMDLSASGWGKKWDYIIIHESGHEWFANNITTNDIADMWVHEGFTDYSEPLFVECLYGKQASDEYTRGLRRNIANDKPVIGPYGVNKEGSGDMYAKGANMLHTIRQVIDNDAKFKEILRGLNKDFYHRTVDSRDVEKYMSEKSGKDLSKIFDQYLRTTKIPVLEYKMNGRKLSYRWTNCINGFNMPVQIGTRKVILIEPKTEWHEIDLPSNYSIDEINKNFYITIKNVSP